MKKIQILVACIIITCIGLGCYSPYDTFERYPWYRAECWYCEEIDMTIRFSVDEQGEKMSPTYSQLLVDGTTYNIRIGFQQQAIGFMYDLDGDGLSEEILNGTWACWGEQMVITIYEESIWNGQYTELVFLALEQ